MSKKHRFRLALFGHKTAETGAACLIVMLQGQLAGATLGHLAVASETGLLTVFPLLGLTLTRHARHFGNRWTSAVLVGACTLFADAIIHGSHFPGKYTEAAVTAAAASVLSIAVSYTAIGRYIDRLAESFAPSHSVPGGSESRQFPPRPSIASPARGLPADASPKKVAQPGIDEIG